jgi:Gas vesicle synthesis protein GvpL/GvpF
MRRRSIDPERASTVNGLYVYAFVAGSVKAARMTTHRVEVLDVHGMCAVVQRRDGPPRFSESALREQHDLVTRIGRRYDAIVPVRFGAFVTEDELERVVRVNRKALTRALTRVRGHVQMTTRVFTTAAVPEERMRSRVASGIAYLLERKAPTIVSSPALSALRIAAARFADDERIEGGRTPGAATLFHLVCRGDAAEYRKQVQRVAAKLDRTIAVRVSGPWPPFAFVTELWT